MPNPVAGSTSSLRVHSSTLGVYQAAVSFAAALVAGVDSLFEFLIIAAML